MSEREGCIAFEEDLSAWLDGELDAPRAVELDAHVESCGACADRIAALRSIDAGLRSAAGAREAGDAARLAAVRRNVDERLRSDGEPIPIGRRAPRRRRWVAPLAAASFAAAASAGLVLLVRPAPTVVARDRAIPASEPVARTIAPPPPASELAAQKTAEAFAHTGASAAGESAELELESARDLEMIEKMAALSDAERIKLERNLARWRELSPEEQQDLRARWQRGAVTR